MKILTAILGLAAAALITGCSSEPSAVQIKYPVTYNVQVGQTKAVSDYGPQTLSNQAVQQLTVEVGRPLYYAVDSDFDVLVTVAEVPSPDERRQVSQMQGSKFTTSITPETSTLVVTFAAAKPNTGGNLKFTLSDQPIAQ
jgi:hypothetical protein